MPNPIAQDLQTVALQQQAAISSGFLAQQVVDPTPTYPRRPWIDEPAGSIPFDEQNGIDNPGVGITLTVLQIIVPVGSDGVIKFISNNTAFPFNDFSGEIIWQILRNGAAIRNFDNIRAQKGTIYQGRAVSPIRIYSGDVIQYVVTHVSNVALVGSIICSLNGYYYPTQGLS